MHIPDGFLDTRTALASAGVAATGLGLALFQARRHLPPSRQPLMGLAAAFVFAAQMLNFPVVGGTSGHLMGGVLTAVLLGPSPAVIVMSAVLIVQCFLFNDGGVLVLGANLVNMAVVAPVGGYFVYRIVRRWAGGSRGLVLAAAFAAWCSVVLAAISCAGQLTASGTVAWSAVFPAMVNLHLLIGVGEGLITALVLVAITRTRPELLPEQNPPGAPESFWGVTGLGAVLALALALFVAPFASPWPDGLERVAATLGFESRAFTQPVLTAPMPDYQAPGTPSLIWATALAGALGTVTAFGLSWLLARALVPSPRRKGGLERAQQG